MLGGMITVEDWAEIRRLYHAEKMPKKHIAEKLGISRNTVAKAVASMEPPKYRSPGTCSGEIHALLRQRQRALTDERSGEA